MDGGPGDSEAEARKKKWMVETKTKCHKRICIQVTKRLSRQLDI